MNDDDMDAVFRQEAAELIESLERGLLDLSLRPEDAGLINAVFRDLHTIKGSGAMFGFTDLAAFVHAFETAFDRVRSGRAAATPELIRIALRARDEIGALLEGAADPDGRRAAILADLELAVAGRAETAPTIPLADSQDDHPPTPVAEGPQARRLRFHLNGDALALGARPELILDELRELGAEGIRADLSRVPPLDALDPEACLLGWAMTFPQGVTRQQIDEVFLFHDAEVALDAAAPALPETERPCPLAPVVDEAVAAQAVLPPVPVREPDAPPSQAAPAQSETAGPTMRVAAERLDRLMERVGELVIAEARLSQLADTSRDPALLAAAEEIKRLASSLRDTTMQLRMVPLRSLVARFRRLMHGLSEKVGKPIDFRVKGEETELDKTVIEQLADPLVHILRNAVDHGLEAPDQRRAAGKPDEGRIELSAEYSGAEVLIRVRDDGRGLDADRIRAKGVAAGLIPADATLSEAAIFALVLEPGFSTAEQVTELSGRGVGMDVVRKTIETLRGTIEIRSKRGEGTSVILRLPLTLAIIEGLLVEVAGERFTIPLAAVQEIVELPPEKTEGAGGPEFLDIRSRLVPFLRLRQLFDSPGTAPDHQTVVVTRAGDSRTGIVVDRIIGTNQIVIKQMSRLHSGVRAISGATILGDGSVALILDVSHLAGVSRTHDDRPREAAA
ncbi:chemotaxis protein CheA [Plastorhodobacter daqingensis]|uniref:Chemotaxis protein CheA n=1 Tax=Plastorhodobacter daqingensis TaxID=1387281 RepID=A0ABW2URK9_9RHOB